MCRFLLLGLLFLISCAPQTTEPDEQASSSSSSAFSSATSARNTTGLPLTLPAGTSMEIFAKNLPGARVIVQDGFGNFWVSQPGQGTITQLEMENRDVKAQHAVFRGLKRPHGLALDPGNGFMLFIAEEHRVSRVPLYSDGPMETIYELPAGGRHFTRTLGFGPAFAPDGATEGRPDRLYVSIGSTCDVCVEKDERIAAILSMNQDGSDAKIVAKGLRNAVFFTWSYVDGRMWATEMGRDNLGDDLPPDEVNIIKEGAHYGWPYCYGKQVFDRAHWNNQTFDCATTEPSAVDLPAHVAPLGLAFVPEEGWPEEWWYDLLIAQHGSWNRSEKVGYSIARVPLDAQGNVEGPITDFIDGWLEDDAVTGRPVDILIRPGGLMYVTDDKKGVVYRVQFLGATP